MPLTVEELKTILELGHETPGVEFKGPERRDNQDFFVKVIKGVLGMANRRGGGKLVVGISDDGGRPVLTGLSDAQAATWGPDAVVGPMSAYADPFVTVSVQILPIDGTRVVVLTVDEFESVPVICKRSYPGVLRDGACYVRRRGRIETSEVPNHSEMRELLDLATETSVRAFLQTAGRVGLGLPAAPAAPNDEEKFRQQAEHPA